MDRVINKIQLGQRRERELIQIKSDATPGPQDGNLGFRALWDFIQSLEGNPGIIRFSVECPESIRIFYDRGCWVLETSADVDKMT